MSNKAIFLDRDDTLIEDPGYINNPDQVKLIDVVPEALITLKAMGYKLVVVSNQSGVARGFVTEEVLRQIHKRLEQLLAEKGASIDRIYYCPFHPEGVIAKYRRESDLRKPSPGMLLTAAKDMDIDLEESWMVGNGSRDIEAGARAGCRTILVDSRGHEQKIQPGQRYPDYRAVNLKEVINIIKMYARSPRKQPAFAVTPTSQTQSQRVEEPPPPPAEEQPESRQQQEPPPQVEPEQLPAQQSDEEQPTIEQLLSRILDHLKVTHRTNMFGDFSISRMIAGILQVLVFFCLLVGIWFLMSPAKQLSSVLIALGFGILLQLMVLTFYTMQGPR